MYLNFPVKVELDLLIEKNWDKLLKPFKEEKIDEVGLALHRLRENFIKLFYRYKELGELEKDLYHLKPEEMDKNRKLHFYQVALIDKTEAFHQQIYATLSTLILVLNYLGMEGQKSNHPINSVKKFLEFLTSKKYPYRSTLKEQVHILNLSRHFRAVFADHPQQHKLHDWMTYGYEGKYYIIYFIREGSEIYSMGRGDIDPLSPEFRPPVNCGDNFYVAPDKERAYKAMKFLTKRLLKLENDK